MNKKFSVLSLDQVVGDKRLDVFNRYGLDAEVTDYAIKRGTECFKLKGKYYAAHGLEPNGQLLDKYVCEYWTSTKDYNSITKAYAIGGFDVHTEAAWSDDNGVRIVVPLADIKDEITDAYTIQGDKGEVRVVTFGEYPQTVLKSDEAEEMFNNYQNGLAKPTGKEYGAVGYRTERYYDGNTRKFEEDDYKEYEFEGERYVLANKACFDNGSSRKFWAKVEPIEWIIDEESGLAITKKCIIGGIPLNRKGLYFGNFDKTRVQMFLDNDFAIDCQVINKTKELYDMTNEEIEEEENEMKKSL